MTGVLVQFVLCVAVGLAPGAYVFWGSRGRRPDDPVLRERHWATYLMASRIVGLLIPTGIMLGWGRWEALSLALMPVGLLAGSYPGRKAAWGETWGFLDYAADRLGQLLALMGLWVFVAVGPVVVMRIAGPPSLKALALFLALAAWTLLHGRLVPRLLRARPVDDPTLLAACREIAARSAVPMPALLRAGVPGGIVANGHPFPGIVVLGRTLLAELPVEESAAIFAHEQAHLEHFQGERRWRNASALAAASGAAAVVYLADRLPIATWLGLGWLILVTLFFTRRQVHIQKRVLACDRRAVELCGDAAVYVRALSKAHALMGIPRRWNAQLERTTPSLARRLAAIHVARAEPPAPTVALAAGAHPGLVAVLDGEGVRWFAGVEGPVVPDAAPTTGRLTSRQRYEELRELLVGVEGLTATDRQGQMWRVRLTPDDTRRAQVHLDAIDHRIGTELPRTDRAPGHGMMVFFVVSLAAFCLTWMVASSARRQQPPPVAPAPAARVGAAPAVAGLTYAPLSPEHTARLREQRALIANAVEQRYERKLSGTAADLKPLQQLVDDRFYARHQTYELQALGVAFGDVVATELGLHWVTVTDEYGTDPTLRLPESSWQVNAATMISKRVEDGEEVDLAGLLRGIRSALAEFKAASRP